MNIKIGSSQKCQFPSITKHTETKNFTVTTSNPNVHYSAFVNSARSNKPSSEFTLVPDPVMLVPNMPDLSSTVA